MSKKATPYLCPACKVGVHKGPPVKICQCSEKDCICLFAQVFMGIRTERGGWVR